jgi:hypothetical protein
MSDAANPPNQVPPSPSLPDLLLRDARSIIAMAQGNAVRSVEFHRVEMYWK